MLDLKDRGWREFVFDDIFVEIRRGKRLKTADHKSGKTPYVSSSGAKNGVDNFISNDVGVRMFENCLTIANSGNVGKTFYHKYAFIASDHVTQLKDQKFSKYIYLFLATIISRLEEKYCFNREINDLRIKREIILLPITDDKLPDWQFMEDYIKEREKSLVKQYVKHIPDTLERVKTVPLKEKEWAAFPITDIFEIKPGKRLTKADMKKGARPFIGATDSNNGITNFISNTNISLDKNILGVNYNGSVVETFYHPYECVFSDDVKRFKLKNAPPHKLIYLFLKTAIIQQKSKYAYGYKFNEERMNKQSILLPITDSRAPDWDYMEQYAKSLMANQLRTYSEYVNKKIGDY